MRFIPKKTPKQPPQRDLREAAKTYTVSVRWDGPPKRGRHIVVLSPDGSFVANKYAKDHPFASDEKFIRKHKWFIENAINQHLNPPQASVFEVEL